MTQKKEEKVNTINKYDCTISCTGDVCCGDIIHFSEAVFNGSFGQPKYQGERWIFAEVIADSYGVEKQQHTFTLRLIECEGESAEKVRTIASRNKGTIKRKGRNIYKNGTYRRLWKNEDERDKIIEEKHKRGNIARTIRAVRRDELGYDW